MIVDVKKFLELIEGFKIPSTSWAESASNYINDPEVIMDINNKSHISYFTYSPKENNVYMTHVPIDNHNYTDGIDRYFVPMFLLLKHFAH